MSELIFLTKLFSKHILHQIKPNLDIDLSPLQKKIIFALKTDGCYVLPNYFDQVICASYRDEINSLLSTKTIKVWRDKDDSDKRIYGADQVSQSVQSYYTDKFINQIIDYHEKSHEKSGFTMAARMDYKEHNLGSGGGWHKDRADKIQTKSLLYLTDVSTSDGPFQYIKGSQRPLRILADWILYGIKPSQTRINEDQISKIIAKDPKRLTTCIGTSGTILFVNTLGLHQGKPIETGFRMAMTNYYWFNSEIPKHIAKQLQR